MRHFSTPGMANLRFPVDWELREDQTVELREDLSVELRDGA